MSYCVDKLIGKSSSARAVLGREDVPCAEVNRLLARTHLWALAQAIALCAQVALHRVGMFAPGRLATIAFVHGSSLIWASYAQADALLPVGDVRVPVGPLRWFGEAICAAAPTPSGGLAGGSVAAARRDEAPRAQTKGAGLALDPPAPSFAS